MRRPRSGFSLVEVVIAVAIVGIAVLGILGLLASLARNSAEARERLTAAGLADAVAVELRRQVDQDGWEGVVASVSAGEGSPGLRLVARRDGGGVRPAGDEGSAAGPDRFFLIEARRVTGGALATPASAPVVPLRIRVRWPHQPAALSRSTDGAPDPGQAQLEYLHVLNR